MSGCSQTDCAIAEANGGSDVAMATIAMAMHRALMRCEPAAAVAEKDDSSTARSRKASAVGETTREMRSDGGA